MVTRAQGEKEAWLKFPARQSYSYLDTHENKHKNIFFVVQGELPG